MSRNILLITEGEVTELNVFENAFRRYGFNTISRKEKLKFELEESFEFEKSEFSLEKDNVVIIQGPRTRIHDFLKFYDEHTMSLDKFFNTSGKFFSSVFLIYDVDHNDCEDVELMFQRFQDESTGMLLLSSPCIEVLADYDHVRKETKYNHLKEYKRDLNLHYNGRTYDVVEKNFDRSLLYYLEKNQQDFQENNIMEHPGLIVKMINERNKRVNCKNPEDSYVIYRYFSTVVYVAIAHAHGLTREIDNYGMVHSFFENNIRD